MADEHFGFVATRFSGNDGVSLESKKWSEVLCESGNKAFWYAGLLDRDPGSSFCVPEAHFNHSENLWIGERVWGKKKRSPLVTKRMRDMSEYLKDTLHEFIRTYDITFLILENSLSLPMNIPLGIALTELLNETTLPAIAHHHDFYWQRPRYSVNAVHDFLEMAFPPRDRDLLHAVVNQSSRENLSWRKGISSTQIPYVLDFESEATGINDYNRDFKEQIGLDEEAIIFLQPTRVVPRKGIENAIRLISMLDNPNCHLVVTHKAGDEGHDYEHMLKELAERESVNIHFIGDRIGDVRRYDSDGNKIFRLWDVYPLADFVTYPSTHEGFGNAFLESIYFKIPLLVNRYDSFMRDIEPKGFKTITMDGYITEDILSRIREVLNNPEKRQKMVEHNFELGKQFFGYPVLRNKLKSIVSDAKGG